MAELFSLNAAYGQAESLYGVTPDESTFEDIAIDAWERIGNKHTRLYRYVGDVHDGVLELPCNVDVIESVHIPIPDAQLTTPADPLKWTDSLYIEGYTDLWKRTEDPYWTRGKLVKYDEGQNELYFSRDYPRVMVVYHGIFVDENGLPIVNQRELRAIATFVAYVSLYKEALKKKDANIMKLAMVVKEDWLRQCNAARIKEHFSQNDMDRILDVVTRWDRKQYGKSFKGIL